MGRRPKQTLLQRRHTDGQNAHEKMLSMTNYQINTNQNYNEVSPHMDQNGYHQKIYNKKCLRGSVSSTLNISSFPFSPSFQCLDSIILFLFSPFSSVTQTCPILCDPMNCNKPGFPVHHQLLELTQTHVHQVSDAIQLSHPLSSPSLPVFNLSQHLDLFQ